jgi:hypothetical protein
MVNGHPRFDDRWVLFSFCQFLLGHRFLHAHTLTARPIDKSDRLGAAAQVVTITATGLVQGSGGGCTIEKAGAAA